MVLAALRGSRRLLKFSPVGNFWPDRDCHFGCQAIPDDHRGQVVLAESAGPDLQNQQSRRSDSYSYHRHPAESIVRSEPEGLTGTFAASGRCGEGKNDERTLPGRISVLSPRKKGSPVAEMLIPATLPIGPMPL